MKLKLRLKGGAGSGHRGHAGRPGKRGGSAPGVGEIVTFMGVTLDTNEITTRSQFEEIRGRFDRAVNKFSSEYARVMSEDEYNMELKVMSEFNAVLNKLDVRLEK